MKREMKTVRSLLRAVEASEPGKLTDFSTLSLDTEYLREYLELVKEAGLVHLTGMLSVQQRVPVRLTWAGHEYLREHANADTPPSQLSGSHSIRTF